MRPKKWGLSGRSGSAEWERVVLLGDFNRRFRRTVSFIVSAVAVVVALASMAVADGGPSTLPRPPRSDRFPGAA